MTSTRAAYAVALTMAVPFLVVTLTFAGMTDYGKDVCADDPRATFHCDCVGKSAYHKGPTGGSLVGKVIGVVWKKKGSCRSKNCQVLADRDGYYLVPKDAWGQLTKDPRETRCR